MKTSFHIVNKKFYDYLKITINDKEYYFSDDITIEYDNCNQLNAEIEFVRTEDYFRYKIKNPFIRFLINIVLFIISVFNFLFDNGDGIGLHKGFFSFDPFVMKKSFSINDPSEKVLNIEYIRPKYNKTSKSYSKPNLNIQNEFVACNNESICYSEDVLKKEWKLYHIPVFSVIMIIILLLNVLIISGFVKVISEVPLCSMSENFVSVIGISFCSLVIIALLVAYIIIIVKSYNLCKIVNKNNL